MKTSIIQLLDEKPLRVLTPGQPEMGNPETEPTHDRSQTTDPGEANNIRSLLISFLLVLLTYYAMVKFLG